MQNITELIEKVFEANKAKGFWDKPRNLGEVCSLVAGEATGEWLDAHRNGKFCALSKKEMREIEWEAENDVNEFKASYIEFVKGTMEEEVADTYIRFCDVISGFFGHLKGHWIAAYDIAGDAKLRFFQDAEITGEWTCSISHYATTARFELSEGHEIAAMNNCFAALRLIEKFSEKFGCDLEWHVEMKMKYNETREHLHGKSY